MRKVAGVLIGIAGVLAAGYVGVVVFFIGGIEKIVDGVNAHPTDGHEIAWGVIQIVVYDSVIGVLALLAIGIGYFIAVGSPPRWLRRRRQHQNRQDGPLLGGPAARKPPRW